MGRKNKNMIGGALAFALLLFSTGVFAAESFFAPTGADKSLSEFLIPAFGELFGGADGGPLASAVGVLNAAALTIAGVLAAYILGFGTMQTAHDGEMLGKRWSSMWMPIRTVAGTSLLVPLGKGYCAAQYLIAWLVLQGIGLADATWSTFSSQFAEPASMAPRAPSPAVDQLAMGILRAQICVEGFNATRAKGDSTKLILPQPMAANYEADGISYGGGGFGKDACGKVSYGAASKFLASYSSKNGVTGAAAAAFGSAFDADAAAKKLSQAHMQAAANLSGTMGDLARQIVVSTDSGAAAPSPVALTNAVLAYQKEIATASDGLFGTKDAQEEIKSAAERDGWIMAGAWFMKAAQMQDMVARAAGAVPTTSGAHLQALDPGIASSIGAYTASADAWTRASANSFGISSKAVAEAGDTNNPIQAIAGVITEKIAEGVNSIASPSGDRHPIMAIKDLGDYTMAAAEAGILVSLGAIAGSGAVEGFQNSFAGHALSFVSLGSSSALMGAGTKIAATVGYMMIGLCAALLAFGAALAVYLPMAPFIVFFGTALAWLVLVTEAIIAAPLWAMMHLSARGDEVSGSAREGYMLIVGLMLRPALIILGFCAALVLTPLFLGFLNKIFFFVFKASMAGSIMGLFTIMAMLAIYLGFTVYLAHKGFGLVHVIPDKLLRWMGGGHEQLGEYGEGASRDSKVAVGAAVGAGAQAGAQAGSRTGSVGGPASAATKPAVAAAAGQKASASSSAVKAAGGSSPMARTERAMQSNERKAPADRPMPTREPKGAV